MQGRVRVRVTTATPLDDAGGQPDRSRPARTLDGEPVLPAGRRSRHLIGGIVVRVGDTVYDGSIATQLENRAPADDRQECS